MTHQGFASGRLCLKPPRHWLLKILMRTPGASFQKFSTLAVNESSCALDVFVKQAHNESGCAAEQA